MSRIYFGHQSVGKNIIQGLREIRASNGASKLTITQPREGVSDTPTLIEFTIGENGRPESKIMDFRAALQRIDNSAPAIAMFKYCYLDITAETNVDELFAKHRNALGEMRARHPNLTFVHVTAPLTRLESGPRLFVKQLIGKAKARDANLKRNRFNAMLREAYAGEPIFDLAAVESTHADGSKAYFKSGDEIVYTLAPELTDDGGHLNAAGRLAAAEELVAVLDIVGSRPLFIQPVRA